MSKFPCVFFEAATHGLGRRASFGTDQPDDPAVSDTSNTLIEELEGEAA